jgi:hypothetical protein
MLEKLEAGAKPVEQLRILRAVEVLELIGSAEALQVLHQLKRGTAEEWMTQEVGAALKRLTERAGVRP